MARVRHGLLQWFDPVVVPRKLKVVPRLPREANGKLMRSRLLALFERPGPARGEFGVRELARVGGIGYNQVAPAPLYLHNLLQKQG